MTSSAAELSQSDRRAAIEVTDLVVRRGGKTVLPGISLRVPHGRVTGLMGSSERIEQVINLVGLRDQTRQVARTLSGGELSRASLAVALLGEPDLLILDEPTVDVDPILRRDLWNTFYNLAEGGASLLVSSHVMDEASRCQEIVLMRRGEIIAAGTPNQLLERANSRDLEDAFIALAENA